LTEDYAMITIRYLEPFEKDKTLPLWKESFPEDKPQFLDYYYKEKTKDNRILVAQETNFGQTRIISMLHRNPYRLWVHGQMIDSDYIVAVATAVDKRHQGLMRHLLTQMTMDMYQEGMPFCYLMPADPKIYEPFGFAYIYDQEHWQLKDQAKAQLTRQRVSLCDVKTISEWLNQWLMKHYEIFAFRDEAYIKRLMLELESEDGWLEFLYDNTENLVGIQSWWGVDKAEQRMLLCEEQYREAEKDASPAIMVRIVHLEHCLELLHLHSSCPIDEMEVILDVKDTFCPQNQGTFLWKLDKQASKLSRQDEIKPLLSANYRINLDISVLTQWIFGYQDLPECSVITPPREVDNWLQSIAVWKNIFLDEIV